jgi:hypothetical protein
MKDIENRGEENVKSIDEGLLKHKAGLFNVLLYLHSKVATLVTEN